MWLSRKEGKTYWLPTEAEWEYACRGGTMTRHPAGDDKNSLVTIGNVPDATERFANWTALDARDEWVFTAPVGSFIPNAFGVHDTIGNVYEWCEDVYDAKLYGRRSGITTDPLQSSGGDDRVLRGGSWVFNPRYSRSAFRYWGSADFQHVDFISGFRVVCVSASRT